MVRRRRFQVPCEKWGGAFKLIWHPLLFSFFRATDCLALLVLWSLRHAPRRHCLKSHKTQIREDQSECTVEERHTNLDGAHQHVESHPCNGTGSLLLAVRGSYGVTRQASGTVIGTRHHGFEDLGF